MDSTAQIWEDIYNAGNFMEYPSEFFIRLLRRTESSLGIKGVT